MPFVIDDAPPTADEVAEACIELHRNRACGPSGMRNKDLRRWLADYQKEDTPVADKEPWKHVVEIVESAFWNGELPKALCLSLLVVIPKPCGGVRGIGLLESIWKLIERIIDRRLSHRIHFHDALHGFRKKVGLRNRYIGVLTGAGARLVPRPNSLPGVLGPDQGLRHTRSGAHASPPRTVWRWTEYSLFTEDLLR